MGSVERALQLRLRACEDIVPGADVLLDPFSADAIESSIGLASLVTAGAASVSILGGEVESARGDRPERRNPVVIITSGFLCDQDAHLRACLTAPLPPSLTVLCGMSEAQHACHPVVRLGPEPYRFYEEELRVMARAAADGSAADGSAADGSAGSPASAAHTSISVQYFPHPVRLVAKSVERGWELFDLPASHWLQPLCGPQLSEIVGNSSAVVSTIAEVPNSASLPPRLGRPLDLARDKLRDAARAVWPGAWETFTLGKTAELVAAGLELAEPEDGASGGSAGAGSAGSRSSAGDGGDGDARTAALVIVDRTLDLATPCSAGLANLAAVAIDSFKPAFEGSLSRRSQLPSDVFPRAPGGDDGDDVGDDDDGDDDGDADSLRGGGDDNGGGGDGDGDGDTPLRDLADRLGAGAPALPAAHGAMLAHGDAEAAALIATMFDSPPSLAMADAEPHILAHTEDPARALGRHARLGVACAASAAAGLRGGAAAKALRALESSVVSLAARGQVSKACARIARALADGDSINAIEALALATLAVAIATSSDAPGGSDDPDFGGGGRGGGGDDDHDHDLDDGGGGTGSCPSRRSLDVLESAVLDAIVVRGDASVGFLGPFEDTVRRRGRSLRRRAAAQRRRGAGRGRPGPPRGGGGDASGVADGGEGDLGGEDLDLLDDGDGWGAGVGGADDDVDIDLSADLAAVEQAMAKEAENKRRSVDGSGDGIDDGSGSDAAADDEPGDYDELQLRLGVRDLVSDALDRVLLASRERLSLQHHVSLVSDSDPPRIRPLLEQVCEVILDPDTQDMGDVQRTSVSLAGLFQSGFSRFGFGGIGPKQPRPADYSTVMLFVIGGISPQEIEGVSAIAAARGIRIIFGSTAIGASRHVAQSIVSGMGL